MYIYKYKVQDADLISLTISKYSSINFLFYDSNANPPPQINFSYCTKKVKIFMALLNYYGISVSCIF